MFPTLFGPTATGDAAEQARSAAILDVSLAVADRGEQVRSQVRGAIVEELTARLLARRVGTAAVHRERRILFDGVRAEIHPYDVTVERDGAAEAYDCKWGARGINADVLHQLDDARTHAADEDEPLRVALVILDARPLVRGPAQPPDGAVRSDTGLITLETLDELSVGADDRPRAGRLLRPVPRPLRRGGAGRPAPDVGPPALRPGPGLVPLVGPRLRARLVRGARHHLAGPSRGGRGGRPGPGRLGARRDHACRPGPAVSGRGAGPTSSTPMGQRPRSSRSTGSCSTLAACRRASRPSSNRSSGRRRRRSSWDASSSARPGGCRPGDADRAAAGARSDGSRQQRRLCRLARGAGHGGRRPRPTCARSRAWRVSTMPARPRPARPSRRRPGGIGRPVVVPHRRRRGADLLRARLERESRGASDA